MLDGVRVRAGETRKISIAEWRSRSRHYEFVAGPIEYDPAHWNPPSHVQDGTRARIDPPPIS
jgi:hypothetical protein